MFMQRSFFRKTKTVANLIIIKRNYVRSRSVLRYSIITSIRNYISYIIISLGKFIVYSIECFAIVVFGKICDIFKKYDLRFLTSAILIISKKRLPLSSAKPFYYRILKTIDTEILQQEHRNPVYHLHRLLLYPIRII